MRTTLLLRIVLPGLLAATTTVGLAVPSALADPPDVCAHFGDCNDVNGHITRATVIARGQKWVDAGYAYDQSVHVNGTGENGAQKWRTDCSGFISMAWRLSGTSPNYGLNTSSLVNVSAEIPYKSLEKGDILDDPTGSDPHVMLFDGWVGAVGGDFWMMEENGYYDMIRHKASSVQYLKDAGIKGRDAGGSYIPRRYGKIIDG